MKISPQQKIILEHLANGEKVGDIPALMGLSQVAINKYIRAAKDNLGALTTMDVHARDTVATMVS